MPMQLKSLAPTPNSEAMQDSTEKALDAVKNVKSAVEYSPDIDRAIQLKALIDNPTAYEGQVAWKPSDQANLKDASDDHALIMSYKEEMNQSLDKMGLEFEQKKVQSEQLSAEEKEITAQITDINETLKSLKMN